MLLIRLAWHSLGERRLSVGLTLASLTISLAIVLGVEHIRSEVRENFTRTISGTDLIVGARTSSLNLLLYSVFHLGNATNNIDWESYQDLTGDNRIAWSIPLSLGDSHKGYRVVGTSTDFFDYYRYADGLNLQFQQGAAFDGVLDAVIGSEVARALEYDTGENIVLAHGLGSTSFSQHDDAPFTISGILAPTGTPVDRSVLVSLEGIEAIHLNWSPAGRASGVASQLPSMDPLELQPDSITAFMVGLESRLHVFSLQREINEYEDEPLTAILPGVALAELWQTMAGVENILRLLSVLVMAGSLLGLVTLLLTSMQARTRELALYRVVGAHGSTLFALILFEALIVTVCAILLAMVLVTLGLYWARGWLMDQYGLLLSSWILNGRVLLFLLIVLLVSLVLSAIPGLTAYRYSLSSGLNKAV